MLIVNIDKSIQMAEICIRRGTLAIPAILKRISRIYSNQQHLRNSFHFIKEYSAAAWTAAVSMHTSTYHTHKQDDNVIQSKNRSSRGQQTKHYYGVKIGRNPGVYLSWSDCLRQVEHFPNYKCEKFSSEEEAWKYIDGMISLPSKRMCLCYYAVKCGKNPGIYYSWSDCSEQILGYSNPQYRKFTKVEDAQEYLKGVNKSSNSKTFYAVKSGKVPGIYRLWPDCQKQVIGYSKPHFKKFSTEEGAETYMQEHSVAAKSKELYMNKISSLEKATLKKIEKSRPKYFEKTTKINLERPPPTLLERPTLQKPTTFVESSGLLKLSDPTWKRDFHTCYSLSDNTDQNQGNDSDSRSKVTDLSCLKNNNNKKHVRNPGKPSFVYAVKYGKVPGLYHSWSDCSEQITGYSNSLFKKCSTEEEAHKYMVNMPTLPNFSSISADIFYAVIHGKEPGIYHSWSDCSEQIHGYPNALYRKFVSEEEAKQYMEDPDSFGKASRKLYQDPDLKVPYFTGEQFQDSDGTQVWADGSCLYTEDIATAKAGIGVYWGPEDPDNASESISGRQTSARAEIHAAIKAVQLAKKRGINNLIISTDSLQVIRSMTKWIEAWRLKDFRGVVNATDYKILDREIQDINIKWVFVRSHSGDDSNNKSDTLAKMGAKIEVFEEESKVVSRSSGADVSKDKNEEHKGVPLM